jgi:hypothetical protein
MKAQFKKNAIVILASCILFSVYAQINLQSNDIQFRSYYNANQATYHYGDLRLEGGSTGSTYGWLYTNAINCYGWSTIIGNTTIYGSLLVYGSKNFVHPHPTDSTKQIKYIAIESGEALTLARGTSKTVNGQASITLPEHFSLVTSADAPISVLVTPKKVPALLYTKEESKERIVIAMKESDFFEYNDVEFSFQVTGVRDGFEDEEIIVDISNKGGEENISEKRAAYNEKVNNIVDKVKKEKKKSNK